MAKVRLRVRCHNSVWWIQRRYWRWGEWKFIYRCESLESALRALNEHHTRLTQEAQIFHPAAPTKPTGGELSLSEQEREKPG